MNKTQLLSVTQGQEVEKINHPGFGRSFTEKS
jgi:hypothetical protein